MTRGKTLLLIGMAISLAAGWAGFPRVIYTRSAQPVNFSHKVHAEKAGQSCDDCHAFREDGTFAGIPTLDKCASCHAAPMGSTAAEKEFIDRYVTPQREPEWQSYAEQPENVWFPHSVHVKRAGMKCEACHANQGTSDTPRVFERDRVGGYPRTTMHSGMPIPLGMNDCVNCHRANGLEHSCLDCHK
jgi:hypothetical protein